MVYCVQLRGFVSGRTSPLSKQTGFFHSVTAGGSDTLRLQMDFTELIDLAAERLGGAVLFANDEFFAPKENLLKPSAPVFIEGKYTDLGKWMDGWESRRRRTPGFDWCIIRIGLPTVEQLTSDSVQWTEILPQSNLNGDSVNPFSISSDQGWTYLRFKIFP